jgi:histone H3/H4
VKSVSVEGALAAWKALPLPERQKWVKEAEVEQARFLEACTAALEEDADATPEYGEKGAEGELPMGFSKDDLSTSFPVACMSRLIKLNCDAGAPKGAAGGPRSLFSTDARFVVSKVAEAFLTRRVWDSAAAASEAQRRTIRLEDVVKALQARAAVSRGAETQDEMTRRHSAMHALSRVSNPATRFALSAAAFSPPRAPRAFRRSRTAQRLRAPTRRPAPPACPNVRRRTRTGRPSNTSDSPPHVSN